MKLLTVLPALFTVSRLAGLFWWGTVLKCLSELVEAYPGFAFAMLSWSGYALWGGAGLMSALAVTRYWLHRQDVQPDPEVHRES